MKLTEFPWMQSKVAYVDFVENFGGIDTVIRIFETRTHLFVYVNQSNTEIHLYNEFLKNILIKKCHSIKNKQVEVICNLNRYDCIDEIGQQISNIVNG